MTVHPIDTEALRATAEATIEEYGFLAWPDIPSADLLALLDALAAAEAEVKRLSWKCGHLADKYDTDTEELRQEVDRAEARTKAVEDVLTEWESNTIAHQTMRVLTDIQKALAGEGP